LPPTRSKKKEAQPSPVAPPFSSKPIHGNNVDYLSPLAETMAQHREHYIMSDAEKSSKETLETNESLDSGNVPFEYPMKHNHAMILGYIPEQVKDIPLVLYRGKHAKDKHWRVARDIACYYDLIDELSCHRIGKKIGDAILQGSLIGEERKAPAIDALYVMGLDIDSGIHPESVIERLQALGMTAIIYTTHSHLKTDTFLVEEAFNQWCKRNKLEHAINEAPLEQVKRYLIEARYWEKWVADSVEVGEVAQTADGKGWWLSHSPMPKFRAIFPLSSPYVIAQQHMSQKDAINLWKRKLIGLANMLELPLDQSCLDPSRLFYLPRHAEGSQFGVWVTGGESLDFEKIPEGQVRGRVQNPGVQNQSDVFAKNGGEMAREKRPHVKSADDKFNYSAWVATNKMSENFDIAALFRNAGAGQVRNEQTSTKLTVTCPFDDSHSNAGDPEDAGCWVESPDPATGINSFVFSCSHNSCKGRDRLEMIAEAVNQGWFTFDDLQDRDYHLGLTDEAPLTTEEALARLTKEIEETVTPNTADSAIDSFFEKLADLDTSPKQRDTIIDLINDKREVTKPRERNKLNTRLGDLLKKVNAKRLKQKAKANAIGTAKQGGSGLDWLSIDADGFMPCLEKATDLLLKANEKEPRLFNMGGAKVLVYKEASGKVKSGELTQKALLTQLRRVANWYVLSGEEPKSVDCDSRIADDILYNPDLTFPGLERVSHVPFFTQDGELVAEYGYHPASRVFCALPEELTNLDVPENPTPEQVEEAVEFVNDNLFKDFPFSDNKNNEGYGYASRANAWAMLLERPARALIDNGPTPLYFIVKPQHRTGGTHLAECVMMSVLGKVPGTQPQVKDEAEQRKNYTSGLTEGMEFYYVDNIKHQIGGGVWPVIITASEWKDRLLNYNDTVEIPNRCTKVVTGNKPDVTDEMGERLAPIRLATKGDPKKRNPDDFKHKDLKQWVLDNRPKLIKHVLTIIRAWVVAGKPAPKNAPHLAGFEAYVRVMGGILENANIQGFLGNLSIAREASEKDRWPTTQLLRSWAVRFGDSFCENTDPSKDLDRDAAKAHGWDKRSSIVNMILDAGIDTPGLSKLDDPDETGMSKAKRAGTWLRNLKLDEAVNEIGPGLDVRFEIVAPEDPRNKKGKANVYRLECVDYNPRVATDYTRRLYRMFFDWKGAASELVLEWGSLPDWTDVDEAEAEADKLQRQAARLRA
jgi:hypothetical protein